MAVFSISGVRLVGIAATVPATEVSNLTAEVIPEPERKLFVRTTGIEKRRIAKPGTCTSDLCEHAATRLLDALGWRREEIKVLIFLTQTPDYITPATAALLQERLGLSKSCMAFDINLGCSGYPYGLSVAASLLANMPGAKGLLLAGDVSSACVSPLDKSAAPIFSDAGSATALAQDADAPAMHFNLETDGRGYRDIIIPEGAYRHPITANALQLVEESMGIVRNKTHLALNGINVFNFSVQEAPQNVNTLLAHVGVEKQHVDFFVFHQANKLINDAIRKKLGLTIEQTPETLARFGNTSSATIPVTIASQLQAEVSQKPCQLMLCGFGVGLSWGSALVQTQNVVCLPVLEADL